MCKEQTDRLLALEEQLRLRDETEAWLRQVSVRAEELLTLHERKISVLTAQLDKLRRMKFGRSSEKRARQIAVLEAELAALEQSSDEVTGRVNDPSVPRALRQTRTRKPFPESLPREVNRLLPAEKSCPDCGGSLSYLGKDAAEQLELMRHFIGSLKPMHARAWS